MAVVVLKGVAQRVAEQPVLIALGAAWALTAGWFLFWPVPTEVIGRGVVIVPGGSTVIDARAEGQILSLPVRVGEAVRRQQPLISLYLPALEQQLRRQERDLAELIRINTDLDKRDQIRLAAAQRLRNTALAKLEEDRSRFNALRRIYDQKVADFRHLARREVVAPWPRRWWPAKTAPSSSTPAWPSCASANGRPSTAGRR